MGAYFSPATCKMTLGPEIFPAGIRESVKICKLLPHAGSIFPHLGGEKRQSKLKKQQ